MSDNEHRGISVYWPYLASYYLAAHNYTHAYIRGVVTEGILLFIVRQNNKTYIHVGSSI